MATESINEWIDGCGVVLEQENVRNSYTDLNPDSVTHELGDFGEIILLCKPWFSHLPYGDNGSTCHKQLL